MLRAGRTWQTTPGEACFRRAGRFSQRPIAVVGCRGMNEQSEQIEPLQYLTTAEVAQLLAVSIQTLERHRRLNRGLPFVRLEGAVRYRRDEIEQYLAQATVYPPGTEVPSASSEAPCQS